MPTGDLIAVPSAIEVQSATPKLSKHDKRKLRNMAYHQICKNSPGVPKGIVKQVAFNRAKKAFAHMQALQPKQ